MLKRTVQQKILTEHLLTNQLKAVYPRDYRKLQLYYRLYDSDYSIITAVSQAVKDELVDNFAINPAKITVIYNGLPAITPVSQNHNGYFNIGNATHFEKIKNIELFLEIAAALIETDRSFKFYLIGDGTQKPAIISFIKQQRMHNNIFVLEPAEDLTHFFAQINLGLITSWSETFSLYAAECLLRGIPVVATATGGLKEVVKHNHCGYLIDSFSKGDFVTKILQLKNDKATYQNFAAQARDYSSKFTIENIYQQYHQLYCKVTNTNN